MNYRDVIVGTEVIYGGGPVVGGWFTVMCRVEVLQAGNGRFQIRHVDGKTPGKVCWVTPAHLSLPEHFGGTRVTAAYPKESAGRAG